MLVRLFEYVIEPMLTSVSLQIVLGKSVNVC